MTRQTKDKLCLELSTILTELDNCNKYRIDDKEYIKQLNNEKNKILKLLNKYYK